VLTCLSRSCWCSDDEVQQHAEADRREVDPPIEAAYGELCEFGQVSRHLN
jgi:hypothetical protein